jgi:3-deoxy-D-manno-octulosonate 8-phosphate phosphatase (KDO 8-P phosphatase)
MIELSPQISNKLKKIKTIVTDVDGILNNGTLYITADNKEFLGEFNAHDGVGIVMAIECGIQVIVISHRDSLCTQHRCAHLGITEIHTGIANKQQKLAELMKMFALEQSEVLYIGDDLIDIPAMKISGFSVAPSDAVDVVKNYVDYITKSQGGRGVFREVVNLVTQVQGTFDKYLQQYI